MKQLSDGVVPTTNLPSACLACGKIMKTLTLEKMSRVESQGQVFSGRIFSLNLKLSHGLSWDFLLLSFRNVLGTRVIPLPTQKHSPEVQTFFYPQPSPGSHFRHWHDELEGRHLKRCPSG